MLRVGQLLVVVSLLTWVVLGKDLTLDPGHLKPFGEGRPSKPIPEINKFPNPEYFFENFVKPLKPLKMVGAAKYSPAFKKWKDEYLLNVKAPKNHVVTVETKKKEDREQEAKQMSFVDFVKTYNNSETYMVDSVPPFLSDDVIVPCPLQCGNLLDGHLVDNIMWFSSGGTKSVVHTDSVDNINCLFRGEKTLVMVDPALYGDKVDLDKPHGAYSNVDVDSVDYTKYPGLAEVEFYHVNISAGDCLYIPYMWIHQVRSYGSNLAVNVWWRHHLTQDLDYSQCNNPCDTRLTLQEVEFEGFDNAFVQIQPSEIRAHLLTAVRAGSKLTWEDFVNSLIYEGYSLAMANSELQTKVKELFEVIDIDKDGVVTRQEIQMAPDEVFVQAQPLMQDIFEMVQEEERTIDIDDGLEEETVDDRDPDETDRADLHEEL